MEEKCKNCRWWQDWQARVYARLSMARNATAGGSDFELRMCKYRAPPGLECHDHVRYTDENYVCGAFTRNGQ